MKINRFLNVVPRKARITAGLLIGFTTIAGLVFGFFERILDHLPIDPAATVLAMGIGLGAGLLAGCFLAIWVLCVGFVYADAKRRAMRAVLWVWFVILCPHLLGFLLYFVLRQPIASPCAHCGEKIPQSQRFCPWCGNPKPASTSGDPQSDPGSSGLNSAPVV